jgi:hypothetical protein
MIMTSLAERAAAMAGRPDNVPVEPTRFPAPEQRTSAVDHAVEQMPPPLTDGPYVPLGGATPRPVVDLPPAPDDAAQVAVHVAWARVMADVQTIRKDSVGDLTGRGKLVNFRGVDSTMNAFGAAQRRHGVIVRPVAVVPTYRDTTTSKGNKMREATVVVTYEITGPMGDSMPAVSVGEALDTGDKATAKAMSVALRTLLLQAGMVPTEMPRDPDQDVYERGEAAVRPAGSYRDEIVDPDTSAGRIRQIGHELKTSRQLGALVADVDGEELPIGDLVTRVWERRRAAQQPATAGIEGGRDA